MSGFVCKVAVALAADVHTTSVNRKTITILSYDHAHTFHMHSFIYSIYIYMC